VAGERPKGAAVPAIGGVAAQPCAGLRDEGSLGKVKCFFFEKKGTLPGKQKTFGPAGFETAAALKGSKSFLLLFFKKEALPFGS
jgi:hypothetical protein